jgi:prephenate dehydratase
MVVINLGLPELSLDVPVSIATLGPPGTSSEATAESLFSYITYMCSDGQRKKPATQLHGTYESAGKAVLNGDADLLLVANAYADIAQFYMNPALSLAAALVHDTPEYGIAALPDKDLPSIVRVATHPAPVPLIAQLMPAHLTVGDVIAVTSTSVAASAARTGEVEVALTTARAAKANGLTFISRTRPIRMLWSVFRRQSEGPRGAVARDLGLR